MNLSGTLSSSLLHSLFIDQTETRPGRDSVWVWNRNYKCIPTTKISPARPRYPSRKNKEKRKNDELKLFWILWPVASALIRIYLDSWNWAEIPSVRHAALLHDVREQKGTGFIPLIYRAIMRKCQSFIYEYTLYVWMYCNYAACIVTVTRVF